MSLKATSQIVIKEKHQDAVWHQSLAFDSNVHALHRFRSLGKGEVKREEKNHPWKAAGVGTVAGSLPFADDLQIVFEDRILTC